MKLKPQAKTKIIKAIQSGKLEPVSSVLNKKSQDKAYQIILDYVKKKMTDLAYDESLLVYTLLDKLRSYTPENVSSTTLQNGLIEIVNTIIDQTIKVATLQTENRGGIRAIMNQIRIFESLAQATNLSKDEQLMGLLSIIFKWSDLGHWKPYTEKDMYTTSIVSFMKSKNDLEKLFGQVVIDQVEEML
ncbi:hypothetical protein M0R19_04575 [Candidatus Pacearchaeota archaeon]|jgi:hypothetical protein|nr:hypothetical protein [Candidatus Pacearchaeota archaeon]